MSWHLPRQNALLNRALEEGTIPVIVRFKSSSSSQSKSTSTSLQQAAAFASKRNKALRTLGLDRGLDRAGNRIKHFTQVPGLAMQADALDVSDLLADPDVEDVTEDIAYPPALVESVPLLGADADRSFGGYTGLGQTVAILDSGVDKTHPFLAGKVISEACYSTTYSGQGSTSLCPGGASESTSLGSGVNCSGITGCEHGTHVAGIAAGNGGGFSGVAKDAKVISVKIFSKVSSSACGSTSPCLLAYTSDIIKGLERVYALSGSYKIAAANLSLGGGAYLSPCDSDPTKASIDKLLNAGIATVVASGNNGYYNAVNAPGCVSSAVTVGSTSKADKVSSFSNSASFIDLLAPGESIKSSVPGGSYQFWSGTSMATPHIAGIWAVMKSAQPTASVATILSALTTTGIPITDPDNSIVKPRPRVHLALSALVGSPPALDAPNAAAATSLSASGFTANWSLVNGATTYLVDVSTNSGFTTFVTGYQAADAQNTANLAVTGLSPGTSYYYRVRASDGTATSGYSNTVSATTSQAGPAAPAATAPSNVTTTSFTANWSNSAGTTSYLLDVATDSGFTSFLSGYKNLNVRTALSRTVKGLTPATTYFYRVRAANKYGTSPSSNVIQVTTKITPPATPKATAATSATTSSFQANWSPASGADQYLLDVSTAKAFTTFVAGYSNLAVGANTNVTVTGLNAGTTYYYRVRAVNGGGTSRSSATITAKTLVLPPAAPASSGASNVTGTSFTARWSAAPGATNYYLDVSLDSNFASFVRGYQNLNLKTALSRVVKGLSRRTTYYYRVRAANTGGQSSYSPATAVTTGN